MTPPAVVTDSVRAFLDNDDSPEIRNPIHSTAVAREYGFDGPLIGGVTVWSWCTPAILEALGETWLDEGWCTFRFRRPTYPGDEMAIHIGPPGDEGLRLRMVNQAGVDCVVGEVGPGRASWLGELQRPATPLAPTTVDDRPLLTIESTPVGRDWSAMVNWMFQSDADAYLEESHPHRDAAPPFAGERPRVHPGWLAGRCEAIMRHNQTVPSSMHTQSRMQILSPAYATGPIGTGARVVRVFERKGHHAVVFNALVRDASGRDVALIEHTTIFRIARPGEETA